MRGVNTVLGEISAAQLGTTLMHEHIFHSAGGVPQVYPELFGDDFEDRIAHGLEKARMGGIATIVDATTFDMGRDVAVLAAASRRSKVNIIATTGWWLKLPPFFDGVSSDKFASLFVHEIEVGIAGTSARAGILKAASDVPGVTPEQETILRAVARAHVQTGAPIMLHSNPNGQVGRRQLAILREEGVDLRRVNLGHSNDTLDLAYLLWALEQGCYLGLDRYPGLSPNPLERSQILKKLIDAGFGNRILLSHDWSLVEVVQDATGETQEDRIGLNPHGYLYIQEVVFKHLQSMGVSGEACHRILAENPRSFFEGASGANT